MIDLPKSTEFNKRIPKQKFYDNISITPSLKRAFVEQIKAIYWRNKIATVTTNLASGNDVTEIEIFEIRLTLKEVDESVLKQIDKEIPYHILFLMEYNDQFQAWIGFKELSVDGNKVVKANQYYHTEWMEKKNLVIKLEGLTIDAVYENFVRQIAGNSICSRRIETLKESIEREEKKKELELQIDKLEKKLYREKQFKIQVKINDEIKRIKKELQGLEIEEQNNVGV